jgi:hypothetical protein
MESGESRQGRMNMKKLLLAGVAALWPCCFSSWASRNALVLAFEVGAFSSQVQAGCTCQCINGQMQPLCSSALDIAPPCMGICGPVAPSIAPINPPTIPPLGTTSCRQAQICDQFGNCRWQQVCR